jgi:CotH kinase protein
MKKIFCILLTLKIITPYFSNAQATLTSSKLPIVIVTTAADIPNDPKVSGRLRIVYNGTGQINLPAGPYVFDGLMGIEIRGRTSQALSPKKPYSFELRNPAGAEEAASLLGMPKESDWVLLAPYSDKSLLRDVLAFELARRLSNLRWTPLTRLVEVIVNDDYKGVYVLTERIKRDKNRVDIAKNEPNDPSGGYILKLDKEDNVPNEFWNSHVPPPEAGTDQKIRFLFHYPKPEDVTPQQQNYIKNFMYEFEEALLGTDFAHPAKGYQKYVDRASFIDFMLINEIARNVDGYRLSTYLYKDRAAASNPKLHAGPAWDFNIAFGNANYCGAQSIIGWAWDFNKLCSKDYWLMPFWWQRFRFDTNYLAETQKRWSVLRSGSLSDAAVNAVIDSLNALISDGAAARNFQRWNILGVWQWPNSFVGKTHSEETAFLRDWTLSRLRWMDGQIKSLYTAIPPRPAYTDPAAFPNPLASGQPLNFKFYLGIRETVEFRLIDGLGRTVASTKATADQTGPFKFEWPLPALPAALYFYEIKTPAQKTPVLGRVFIR